MLVNLVILSNLTAQF